MVAESKVSSSHQRSPCCDVPTIGQLYYTARAQATRKFTARPRWPWAVASKMGGADRSASGQYARAPRIRNIDRKFSSTVTVAYHLGSYTRRACIVPRRGAVGRPHPFSKPLPTATGGRAVNLRVACALAV